MVSTQLLAGRDRRRQHRCAGPAGAVAGSARRAPSAGPLSPEPPSSAAPPGSGTPAPVISAFTCCNESSSVTSATLPGHAEPDEVSERPAALAPDRGHDAVEQHLLMGQIDIALQRFRVAQRVCTEIAEHPFDLIRRRAIAFGGLVDHQVQIASVKSNSLEQMYPPHRRQRHLRRSDQRKYVDPMAVDRSDRRPLRLSSMGHGPLALVGSGEYLPSMLPIERSLLDGRPPRYVQIPTAASARGRRSASPTGSTSGRRRRSGSVSRPSRWWSRTARRPTTRH